MTKVDASTAKQRKKSTSGCKVNEKEVMEWKSIFLECDENCDQIVTMKELQRAMSRRSHLEAFGTEMFASMDKDGSGTISFYEFLQAVHPYAPAGKLEMMRSLAFPEKPKVVVGRRELSAAQIAEIRSIFDLYDSDGSGSIDKEELIEAMSATGFDEDEISKLCVENDKNQDGLIQFDEFLDMMRDSYL